MWRRPACQTLLKALDMSSTTAGVAPELLKAQGILSDTTVRRSAVDQEELKPYWISEKSHISLVGQQSCYLQVFQDFRNHRKKSNSFISLFYSSL